MDDNEQAGLEAAEALRAAALIAGLEEAKRRAAEDAHAPLGDPDANHYNKIREPRGGWRPVEEQGYQAMRTPEQAAAAIRQAHGLLAGAAKILGMSRSTLYGYTRRYRCCAEAVEESRETMKDVGEGQLYVAVQRGEAWAVQFYLRTQARDRGYGDHIDVAVVLEEEAKRLSEETGIDMEVLKRDAQAILQSARGRPVDMVPGEDGTWAPEVRPWAPRDGSNVDAEGRSHGASVSHEGEVTPEIRAARKARRQAKKEAARKERAAFAMMMPGEPEHRGRWAARYDPDGRPKKYEIDGKRVPKAEWEVWRRQQRDERRARRGKPPVTDVRYAHPGVNPEAEVLSKPRARRRATSDATGNTGRAREQQQP